MFNLLTEGSSCTAECCEVLTVVRQEVIFAETFFQLFFCSLNNFTPRFRSLGGGAIRAHGMRSDTKNHSGHIIIISTEESSVEEALKTSFHHSMARIS